MTDSFVGRFVVESKDNYDGFMKGVGKIHFIKSLRYRFPKLFDHFQNFKFSQPCSN